VSVLCLDSREVVRVASVIEHELRRQGGRSTKPLIRSALNEDDLRWAGQAFKHLENNGKVTIAGWRVSLGRAA
jgi:hypothetical protein